MHTDVTPLCYSCQTTGAYNNSNFLCDSVYCPALLEVENATNETDTSRRTVGTVIQYQCHDGNVFPDDTKNVTIQCSAQGVWMWNTAPANSHCSGSKTTNFSLFVDMSYTYLQFLEFAPTLIAC